MEMSDYVTLLTHSLTESARCPGPVPLCPVQRKYPLAETSFTSAFPPYHSQAFPLPLPPHLTDTPCVSGL
ncbi:hypothetical protein J6590_096612 [Homalodisca vitripennis]|nr:hypothetical protein J6590_096612 [Homalodisca vitripennis]